MSLPSNFFLKVDAIVHVNITFLDIASDFVNVAACT
jgi:hypothetical protein